MKILHVNMSLDIKYGGGTVERVLQLHKAFLALNLESHILTIDENQIDVMTVKNVTTLPCISKRWFIPFPKLEIVKKLIKDADIIHMMNHWTILNTWVYLVARRLNKPYVICPAGALTIFGRSKIKKHLFQWFIGNRILRNASAVIAISPDEIVLMENMGVEPHLIHHIPNGVAESDFNYNDDQLFRDYAHVGALPYILFVGRLNAIKGPDLLLQAFANNKKNLVHNLIFAGPDEGMEEQLRIMALDFNIADRVFFTGYLGGELKSSAYHGAELLVVPSRHEAMSIVALEAAVSSTPVLLTDQCGFHELVEAGGGIDVPATIDGISDGLVRVFKDNHNEEKMGTYGRIFAIEHYSWTIMAKRFLSIFNS